MLELTRAALLRVNAPASMALAFGTAQLQDGSAHCGI
jgi:hypothetical protein